MGWLCHNKLVAKAVFVYPAPGNALMNGGTVLLFFFFWGDTFREFLGPCLASGLPG
jgi:hypothetical protein